MSNIKVIAKVGFLYMIGTLFYRGISFLMIPIYSRILDTREYGIVNTYTSWVSVITIILSLTLYMGIRAAFIDYEDETEKVVSSVVTFTVLYSIVVSFFGILAVSLLNINVNRTLVLCCLIQSAYNAILNDYLTFLMMKKNYQLRLIFMVLPELFVNIVSVVAILFFYSSEKYMGRIVPGTVVYGCFTLMMLILIYLKAKPNLSKEYLSYCMRISLPLVVHGFSLYILNQSDRIMITSLRNPSETGIYSLVYNIGMLSSAISYALEGLWIPWFTRHMKMGDRKHIRFYADKYTKFMNGIMCVIVMVSPEIMKILSPKEYWEGYVIVPAIVISNFFIFVYTLYVNVEHYYKKTKFIAVNTLIAALCNFTLNYIFIPTHGYVAAAYTTLFSYFISLIMHAQYSNRLERGLYAIRPLIRYLLETLVVIMLYYIFINDIAIRYAITIIVILLYGLSEKNLIIKFFGGLKEKGECKS